MLVVIAFQVQLTALFCILAEDAWTGKWFPNNPLELTSKTLPLDKQNATSSNEWKGKWYASQLVNKDITRAIIMRNFF